LPLGLDLQERIAITGHDCARFYPDLRSRGKEPDGRGGLEGLGRAVRSATS
jgi:hypothetical protein